MINVKRFLEQIQYLWERRSTFKGLIGFLLLAYGLLTIMSSLFYFILKNAKLLDNIGNFLKFAFISAGIYGFITLCIIVLWAYWRTIPKIKVGKIGIIFAPHSDPECTDLIRRLFENFKFNCEKSNLTADLSFKILPDNIIVKNERDAHKLIAKTGARLVIHGHIQKGKLHDELLEGFKPISFTFRHRSLSPSEIRPVLTDLAAAIAYRTFIIREKDSFIDKDIVNENITEVSLFFIAMGLTLDGKIWKSREILEDLLNKVKEKVKENPRNVQLKSFYGSIMSCLSITLLSIFNYVYTNNLIDNITNRAYDNYAEQCLEVLNELVCLDRKPLYDYYVNIAIIYFHFNKIKASREAIEKAKKIAPENAVPHFSSAFIYLWKDDIKKALNDYFRAERQLYDPGVALRVILFLQGLIKLHPKKIQLYFSLAFVNDKFFDKVQAIKDYETFIGKAKDKPKYTLLCDYAKKRMSVLKAK